MQRAIIHVDFDYFYAQCEELRDGSLRTIPVCVCMYTRRGGGAVATANYIARKYGVKSGMPIYRARQLLDETARLLPADIKYYTDISEKAMMAIQQYADVFEYVGRDEAYIDVSARTAGDLGRAAHVAQQIKNSIRESLHMTCSTGISPNRMLSKMASARNKPDGLTLVTPETLESFLAKSSPGDIPGIGGSTMRLLKSHDISTIQDMRAMTIFDLHNIFGRRMGAYIYNSARGINGDPVSPRSPSLQYSRMRTLLQDATESAPMLPVLEELCGEVMDVIQKQNVLFRTITVQFVHADLTSRTRSRTLRNHTGSLHTLKHEARTLLQEADHSPAVRRLGVRVSDLTQLAGQRSITDFF